MQARRFELPGCLAAEITYGIATKDSNHPRCDD